VIYPRVVRWAAAALGGLADAPLLAPSHDGWQGLGTSRGHERGATAVRYGFKEIPLEMKQDGIETRGVECGFLEFSPTAEILPVLDHLSKQLTG
jgi:hypothetical protein